MAVTNPRKPWKLKIIVRIKDSVESGKIKFKKIFRK